MKDGWEDVDGVLHQESLAYGLEIVRTEVISKYYNDPLVRYFGIKKTQELVA